MNFSNFPTISPPSNISSFGIVVFMFQKRNFTSVYKIRARFPSRWEPRYFHIRKLPRMKNCCPRPVKKGRTIGEVNHFRFVMIDVEFCNGDVDILEMKVSPQLWQDLHHTSLAAQCTTEMSKNVKYWFQLNDYLCRNFFLCIFRKSTHLT